MKCVMEISQEVESTGIMLWLEDKKSVWHTIGVLIYIYRCANHS